MTDVQFYVFIATMAGFIITIIGFALSLSRTSSEIRLENRSNLDSIRSEIGTIRSEISANHNNVINLIMSIKDEIKDFHGRLCSIEERYRSGK